MPQLEPLGEAVRKTGSHVGLATDGDADRLGIVDETGEYVNTLQTLSLLLLHVYRDERLARRGGPDLLAEPADSAHHCEIRTCSSTSARLVSKTSVN